MARLWKPTMRKGAAIPLDDTSILALANEPAPAIYLNWRLYSMGAPKTAMFEAPLYTDTRIVGEYETGPLKFINTIAPDPRGMDLRPAIVVRLSSHWPAYSPIPMEDTNDEHYHGGDHIDEIAALAALVMGIRVQAGPIMREFGLRGDPLGTPIMLSGMKTIPALYPSNQSPMVPRLAEPANLTELVLIERLPMMSPETASVLIKSARTYQTALWFADSHPEMAWLFLVSAIESAATHWAKKNLVDDNPFLPDSVAKILREHSCPESVDEPISSYLRETTKSTRKFIAFLMEFLPAPPTERPESQNLRIDFTSGELRKDFQFVYKCRSRALHTGVPFPRPMCSPRREQLKEERNFSLGMSTLGATWSFKKYSPIHFHMFEHIVRGALLRWLGSL
jgi:hypothetical protein